MKNYQFKTNLKCGGCVQAITNPLNNLAGVVKWEADVNHPERILSIVLEEGIEPQSVQNVLKIAGFESKLI